MEPSIAPPGFSDISKLRFKMAIGQVAIFGACSVISLNTSTFSLLSLPLRPNRV